MKRFVIQVLVLFCMCSWNSSDGAKILGIFPISAKSHFNVNNAILKSLSKAGYEITVITSLPKEVARENYTVIDVSNVAPIRVGHASMMTYINMSIYNMMFRAISLEEPYCDAVVKLKEIQEIMHSKKKLYDVIFVEAFILYKCFLPAAQIAGIPVIGTVTLKSSIFADTAISNPHNLACIPSDMTYWWSYSNFIGRLMNTWNEIINTYIWYIHVVPKLKTFHQKYVQELISYENFMKFQPSLMFYNSHPLYLPRPQNPNVIEVGGIHIEPAKELPQDIKRFIDEAEYGVILFSFGSVVRYSSNSTEYMISAFKSAFAELSQKVIWKFDEEISDLPKNVRVMKWVPQRDILEHEKVIAFISHCGQSGTYEAINTGTPVISCPLFGDQHGTAAILEHLEVAVHLDIFTISEDSVLKAIKEIISNSKYIRNMKRLSEMFKNRQNTPQESVVFWTEYVIKYGAEHLKTPAEKLNWFQYFLLDIIFCFSVLSLIAVYITYFSLKLFSTSFSRFLVSFNKEKRC